jgi:sporulation integral membrane protein YlbJ
MLPGPRNTCFKKTAGHKLEYKLGHKPGNKPGLDLRHKLMHKPAHELTYKPAHKLTALLIPAASILFIIFLMVFSRAALISALQSIELWIGTIIPSLFPFLVVSEILSGTGFVQASGVLFRPLMRSVFNLAGCSSYPFILGIISGCPVGAKAVARMRKDNLLNKEEGERLLAFCNNSSPLFITGAVATGMLKTPSSGPFLFICHIASSVTVGFLLGLLSRKTAFISKPVKQEKSSKKEVYGTGVITGRNRVITQGDIGAMLVDAIRNSMATMMVIGGFIIFFSVIISLLSESGIPEIISGMMLVIFPMASKNPGLSNAVISSIISGFFEITTGLEQTSSLNSISLTTKLVLISIIMGWGGLSIHFQVLSAIKNTDLSIKPYLLGKLLHSIFAALYTYIGLRITGRFIQFSYEVFYPTQPGVTVTWLHYLSSSCRQLLFFLAYVLSVIAIAAFFIPRKKAN